MFVAYKDFCKLLFVDTIVTNSGKYDNYSDLQVPCKANGHYSYQNRVKR